jgi:hypothetical protein
MKPKILFSAFILLLLVTIGYLFLAPSIMPRLQKTEMPVQPHTALAAKFDELSKNGNSSCSTVFKDSILNMPDDKRIQGSCCSPMNMHRYAEQIKGLEKYKNIGEIPSNPYDIDAIIAKKMIVNYDMQLTADEQKAYDYAIANSDEKGPCCCKCWRWHVYGGLAKYLIRSYKFTGEQITEVWNLSDGCGGAGDHVEHS